MPEIEVRALTAQDWEAFRALRLEALRTEPGVFSAKLATTEAEPREFWQTRAQGPDHQVFGAFEAGAMFGQIGAFPWWEDPSGATGWIGMLFVGRPHRGTGVSSLLFAAALSWLRDRSQVCRVVVGHRASNIASMRAILRAGFHEARREPHTWPDGATEDEIGYVQELR